MKNVKKLLMVLGVIALSAISSGTDARADGQMQIKKLTVKIGNSNVTKKTYTLVKGKKAALKVSVKPAKSGKAVSFKSSNTKAVTVSKKGKLTAKKAGTSKVIITAKGKDNNKMSTWVKIKVKDDKTAEKNAADVEALKKLIAQQKELGATISEDINDSSYTWDKNNRLTDIYWVDSNLHGSISFAGLDALERIS